MELDRRYKTHFERLIKLEGLDDLSQFKDQVELFEEVPLYSRFSQLSFLKGLPSVEKNRILIRAGAWYVRVIIGSLRESCVGRDYDSFCMLSIRDWEDFPEGGLITPAFWCANPSQGVLEHIRLQPPNSAYSKFVAESLGRDPSFKINECLDFLPGEPHVERVYVQLIDENLKLERVL